jgi:hypothetical protein
MPETCGRGRTQSKFFDGVSPAARTTFTWGADEHERAARAHETSASVRSLHTAARTWNARAHAARRPARPPPRRHERITMRARAHRMQPDGRHGHARRHRHSSAPGNGNDITHLQDHVVVDSNIFNARLHVLSCDVSGGADLVRQLLHSRFVGAVEEFSVGQEIRPVRGVKQVKSGGCANGWRFGTAARSVILRRVTALRMQAKAATMTSAACALSREHACRTKAARGICRRRTTRARRSQQGPHQHRGCRCLRPTRRRRRCCRSRCRQDKESPPFAPRAGQ